MLFLVSAKTFWTCPSCKTGRVAKAEEAKMEVDEELEDEILEDETGNETNPNKDSFIKFRIIRFHVRLKVRSVIFQRQH